MKKIKEISEQAILRYNTRYEQMGYNIKTLGWGSVEQQSYRFKQALSILGDLNEKSLLDIGCGFGDLLNFCKDSSINLSKYTGWDLNKNFIDEAVKRHSETFDVVDISDDENVLKYQEEFDIAIMLGLLNFNLKSEENNLQFSKTMIRNAFSTVKEVLVVDFLSANLTADYPREDFVFYHKPSEVLDFAFSLTPNVILKHDYMPIPQKEFMLFLYK